MNSAQGQVAKRNLGDASWSKWLPEGNIAWEENTLGRSHQVSRQPGISLWVRGHPSASTSYLDSKGFPDPSFPPSLNPACVAPTMPSPLSSQPPHSCALKKKGFSATYTCCGNLQETKGPLGGHACPACHIKLSDIFFQQPETRHK